MSKKPRRRTLARSLARGAEKLGDQRQQLAALEPGGAPERPLAVVSSAVIELRALRDRCLRCDGGMRVDEHAARMVGDQSLRLVRLSCVLCGTPRELWFRLPPSPS